jgi:hypothetical protein
MQVAAVVASCSEFRGMAGFEEYIGLVEQLVCANARVFVGTRSDNGDDDDKVKEDDGWWCDDDDDDDDDKSKEPECCSNAHVYIFY